MIRRATDDDAALLMTAERAASTAALGHIFDPKLDYPSDDVLARWALVLQEPGISVLIDTCEGTAVGYVAFGDGWLRHLGVHPSWWGTGRADRLHDEALAGLLAQGTVEAKLWVLVGNYRARAFYRRHGWVDTSTREEEVFEPHPLKMLLTKAVWDDCAFTSLREGRAARVTDQR